MQLAALLLALVASCWATHGSDTGLPFDIPSIFHRHANIFEHLNCYAEVIPFIHNPTRKSSYQQFCAYLKDELCEDGPHTICRPITLDMEDGYKFVGLENRQRADCCAFTGFSNFSANELLDINILFSPESGVYPVEVHGGEDHTDP